MQKWNRWQNITGQNLLKKRKTLINQEMFAKTLLLYAKVQCVDNLMTKKA